MRRHPLALVASALAVGALLVGCGGDASNQSDASDGASTPAADAEATIAGSDVGFTATGDAGARPVLSFASAQAPGGLQVAVVSEGDGPVIEPGDQVTVDYYGAVWGSDEPFDNSYDRGTPLTFGLGQVIPGWTVGLEGQHVGSRVLMTVPPEHAYGPSGGTPDGSIGAEDTIVFVVDIVATLSADVSGQADATPTDASVPVTWTGELGQPVTAVTVADDATEPTELLGTVLAEGTGAALAVGDQVSVQYTVVMWNNTEADSTWPAAGGPGPQSILVGGGSVFDQFVGTPVGSRVLVEIPANADADATALALVADLVELTPAAG